MYLPPAARGSQRRCAPLPPPGSSSKHAALRSYLLEFLDIDDSPPVLVFPRVVSGFQLQQETLFLAVTYMDRFLSVAAVSKMRGGRGCHVLRD